MLTAVDFFAGSGLVSEGLSKNFNTIWANDIDTKKAEVYRANIDEKSLLIEDISKIESSTVPYADLYWASFPCQDLSLAGNYIGLKGKRSSLISEFFRIVKQKNYESRPNLIILENVYGLITSNKGQELLAIHSQLSELGYDSGSIVIDASYWVPQSRVRVFVVGIKKEIDYSMFVSEEPKWCHPKSLVNIVKDKNDFIYWDLPIPELNNIRLIDIIERDADIDIDRSVKFLDLIPEHQYQKAISLLQANKLKVFSGYKRTRSGKQVLEVRFDEIGGCLRTAVGGSSKQILIFKKGDKIIARYMTPREAARLMGAPDSYWLPKNKNQAYTAMGDAVVVQVTEYLSEIFSSTLKIKREKYA